MKPLAKARLRNERNVEEVFYFHTFEHLVNNINNNNYIKCVGVGGKSGWLVVLPEDWAITGALMGLKSRGLKEYVRG